MSTASQISSLATRIATEFKQIRSEIAAIPTNNGGGTSSILTPTATKTAAYTVAVGEMAMMNVSGGATVLTLPAAPANKAQVGFRAMGASTAVPLTIQRGGSATIGDAAATSVTEPLPGVTRTYQFDSTTNRWFPVSDVKPLSALDARFGGAVTNTPFISIADTAGTGSDDTAAIRDALNRVGPGVTLMLNGARTYRHNQVISDGQLPSGQKSGYTVRGNGARLLATTPTAAAVRINGAGVSWYDTVFELQGRTQRLDAYEAQKFIVFGSNFKGVNLKSKGSAATGFFFTGADGLELDRVWVEDTYADGIHMTGGTKNAKVLYPFIESAGDDGVAVVSYLPGKPFDAGLCENITVVRPVVNGSKAGRGVACVGGKNITYQSVETDDTFASGIYLASEAGTYNTYPVMGVRAVGTNIIRRANRNTDPLNPTRGTVDHGAVMISNQRTAAAENICYDIEVSGVETYDTRATVPWEVGVIATNAGAVNMTGILVRDMKFTNGPATMYNTMSAAQRTATTVAADGKTYQNFRNYDWVRSTTSSSVAA